MFTKLLKKPAEMPRCFHCQPQRQNNIVATWFMAVGAMVVMDVVIWELIGMKCLTSIHSGKLTASSPENHSTQTFSLGFHPVFLGEYFFRWVVKITSQRYIVMTSKSALRTAVGPGQSRTETSQELRHDKGTFFVKYGAQTWIFFLANYSNLGKPQVVVVLSGISPNMPLMQVLGL